VSHGVVAAAAYDDDDDDDDDNDDDSIDTIDTSIRCLTDDVDDRRDRIGERFFCRTTSRLPYFIDNGTVCDSADLAGQSTSVGSSSATTASAKRRRVYRHIDMPPPGATSCQFEVIEFETLISSSNRSSNYNDDNSTISRSKSRYRSSGDINNSVGGCDDAANRPSPSWILDICLDFFIVENPFINEILIDKPGPDKRRLIPWDRPGP